jgi:hypothetical protein
MSFTEMFAAIMTGSLFSLVESIDGDLCFAIMDHNSDRNWRRAE